MMIFGIDAR